MQRRKTQRKKMIIADCKYYPCHNMDNFERCDMCYCPIYHLDCKGNFKTLKNGVKDCSDCDIPHSERGYEYIVEFIKRYNLEKENIRKLYFDKD